MNKFSPNTHRLIAFGLDAKTVSFFSGKILPLLVAEAKCHHLMSLVGAAASLGNIDAIKKLAASAVELIGKIESNEYGLNQLDRLNEFVALNRPLAAYCLVSDLYCWLKLKLGEDDVRDLIASVIDNNLLEILSLDSGCNNKQISFDQVWQLMKMPSDEQLIADIMSIARDISASDLLSAMQKMWPSVPQKKFESIILRLLGNGDLRVLFDLKLIKKIA